MDEFFTRGWARFPHDPAVEAWARHADLAAQAAEADAANGEWVRCAGTWFAGVNALPNDEAGRLPDGPPLTGAAIAAAFALAGEHPLDRGQASVCHPGYPAHGAEETEAAWRYRVRRDSAHVDGLRRIMPGRRRKLEERHAYILGLPLSDAPEGAAPVVVWEGSHEVMREAFRDAFAGASPADWDEVDVTEAYHAARARCFEELERVEIPARPGEAYLIHRLALHGVAPWRAGEGRRSIAYFRPEFTAAKDDPAWLEAR